MDILWFLLAFGIFFAVAVYLILVHVFREMKISNGIRNQDTFAQQYLFRIKDAKDVFLQRLSMRNLYDVLEYTFDPTTMTITFSQYSAKIPYTVIIKELENGCYVKLKKNVLLIVLL